MIAFTAPAHRQQVEMLVKDWCDGLFDMLHDVKDARKRWTRRCCDKGVISTDIGRDNVRFDLYTLIAPVSKLIPASVALFLHLSAVSS